jgi:hypothetical protein
VTDRELRERWERAIRDVEELRREHDTDRVELQRLRHALEFIAAGNISPSISYAREVLARTPKPHEIFGGLDTEYTDATREGDEVSQGGPAEAEIVQLEAELKRLHHIAYDLDAWKARAEAAEAVLREAKQQIHNMAATYGAGFSCDLIDRIDALLAHAPGLTCKTCGHYTEFCECPSPAPSEQRKEEP